MCYRAYVAPVSDITGTELRVAENSRDEKRVISVIPRRDTFHVQLYNARTRRQSTVRLACSSAPADRGNSANLDHSNIHSGASSRHELVAYTTCTETTTENVR